MVHGKSTSQAKPNLDSTYNTLLAPTLILYIRRKRGLLLLLVSYYYIANSRLLLVILFLLAIWSYGILFHASQ